MKHFCVLVFSLLTTSIVANAQLISVTKETGRFAYGAGPLMSPSDRPNPRLETFQGWGVQTGVRLTGQTTTDFTHPTELSFEPSPFGGGPLVRREYISTSPFVHGPSVLDWANPISMIFDRAVDAVGFSLVHRTTGQNETFEAGEAKVFAFDEAGALIGSLLSTATSGSYVDPSTWEFIGFKTADQTASIKAITIYNANWMVAIDPVIRLGRTADLLSSAVPEPSTYGLIGVALLGVLVAKRRRRS